MLGPPTNHYQLNLLSQRALSDMGCPTFVAPTGLAVKKSEQLARTSGVDEALVKGRPKTRAYATLVNWVGGRIAKSKLAGISRTP